MNAADLAAPSTLHAADESVEIARVDVYLFRARVERPMVTAFATLSERSALLVRVTSAEGDIGWGEAYCNFPHNGGEHRLRLLEGLFAPMLVGRRIAAPQDTFDELTSATATLALQTGESGPIAQCIASIDIALWDLVARRAAIPLGCLLAQTPAQQVNAYATGLSPDGLPAALAAERGKGHTAFKLKLGFGAQTDIRTVQTARNILGPAAPMAVDPNQAWTLDEGIRMAEQLAPFGPLWLEEPIAADSALEEWRALCERTTIPLAAGENLYTQKAFDGLIESGLFDVLQPDPIKWGGVTGVSRVARAARAAGLAFCPHFIGTNLGAAACIHLVAALGTAGSLVEVDPNENPLRQALGQPYPRLQMGHYTVPSAPGLGVTPDLELASKFLIAQASISR